MFFAYSVDVPLDRRPVVNWLLIGSVLAAFWFQITAPEPEAVEGFVLRSFWGRGLLGHMWLHGDIIHLVGNLWFLFIFGNAVCSKVRNWAFFPIYLVLGMAAAVVHLIFDGDPAIGASGAINGIIGMYLVYFPLNDINCLFGWGLYFRTISISGFWLIGMWFLFDVWGASAGVGQIAYFAHLGGFIAGVGFAILLQRVGFVTMERDERSLVDIFNERKRQKERQAAFDAEADEQSDTSPMPVYAAPRRQPRNEPVHLTPTAPPAKPDALRFTCLCGQRIKVPLSYAGLKGKCPGCKNKVIIPKVT